MSERYKLQLLELNVKEKERIPVEKQIQRKQTQANSVVTTTMLVFSRERLQPNGKEATATVNGKANGTTRETIGTVASGKVQTALGIGVVGNKPDRFLFVKYAT